VGSEEKRAIAAEHGADHTINYREGGFREEVLALTDGIGANIIYDPVGGDVFTESLRCIAPEGRIMPVGFAGGTIQQIPANILLVKNIDVLGFFWGGYKNFKPQVLTDSFKALIDWYSAGKLKPHVSHVLPLDQANEALDLLRTRKATGKVIVRVS
ncbi:zinc-binding dehydrogenase, partial [uncultured Sulfitobacter sp.]|uniref:zinc-binding dehydrogenase n=1 Tax=uncultured Sulfitobacter sp. TaxID=191468 RepID=UPI0025983085